MANLPPDLLKQNTGMKHQKVIFTPQAHQELLQGAAILAEAVRGTMGPSGHCVVIDSGVTAPIITKDGVTVAKAITLKDKLHSVGAELIKEIAAKTNECAGDGTTTATVLGYEILKEGVKMISTHRSPIGIKRGMDIAKDVIIAKLKAEAKPVSSKEDIIAIGTISANGDREIGELLAEAISKVGEDGIITIEPAKSVHTSLEVVEGMQFESGFVSPYFVTNQEKLTCEMTNPLVLISNRKITALQEVVPVLELALKHQRPLLIIAQEIEGEALHTVISNKMKGVVQVCAVRAPSYGDNRLDLLQDVGIITNGTVIDESSATALKQIKLGDLGSCKKVIVHRNGTTLVGDSTSETVKKNLESRINELKARLAAPEAFDELHKNNYKKRLAKLSGGVALVRVGGSTEVEIFEKKDRVEDALNATIAAVQEGILPGGGCSLFYASIFAKEELQKRTLTEDEQAGVQVILNACKMPLHTIVANTGKSPDVVMDHIVSRITENFSYGYDAYNHVYGDLVEKGIIDPLKVERFALEHATSVVGLLLVCNCVIINDE